MSKRLEMIKRLAETDDYWKGYLDGLNRTREPDAAEWREYARLMQARLARAVDDVADRSEFRPLDEVRARLHARRLDRNADTTDYDGEWTRHIGLHGPRSHLLAPRSDQNPSAPPRFREWGFFAPQEAAMTLFLRTHGPGECSGPFCVIHNPSDHPLRDAPLNWRADKGVMERICPHGIGHDDPDDVAHRQRMGVKHAGVHGCDGCCWKESNQ